MGWFSWFSRNKSQRLVAPSKLTHQELTAHFFKMSRPQQLQVLFYLGVPHEEQMILWPDIEPFKDVKEALERMKALEPITAEMFMDNLKALLLQGKKAHCDGVLQNLFMDLQKGRRYIPEVLKWPVELKSDS